MPRPVGCCGGGEVVPSDDFFANMNDYEIEILCDINLGVSTFFIRLYRIEQDNTISVIGDYDLDGVVYVVTGDVANCSNADNEQETVFGDDTDYLANAPLRVSSYLVRSLSGTVVVDGITLNVSETTNAAADNNSTIPRPTISGGGTFEWRIIV